MDKKSDKPNIKSIKTIIFRGVFLINIILFLVVILIFSYFSYKDIIQTVGELRSDLLSQVSNRSSTVNKSAKYVAVNLYNNLAYKLLMNEDEVNDSLTRLINDEFHEVKKAYEALDINLSTVVLMRNGYEYASDTVSNEYIKSIKSSYWYVNNFTSDKNQLWVTNFGEYNNQANMEISYVKVLRNSKREYQGIIMTNALERTVYDVFSDIINDDNEIYIIDENGVIISHKNKNLVGTEKFYMPIFFNEYKKNSYTIRTILGEKVFFTNHWDSQTKWTIIEEYKLSNIFKDYRKIFNIFILSIILLLIVNLLTSYFIAKKISRPIIHFTKELDNASNVELKTFPIQQDYIEMHMMTIIFNRMVDKIKALIEHVKYEEENKRKIELDFLQAQINPHLFHNTLVSIKCLIELEKNEKALDMLGAFMKLLKAPIKANQHMIPLEEEVEYLKNYISLMKHRYDSNIELILDIEEEFKELKVPRLILQPIVENAIFHGFEDKSGDGQINLQINRYPDKIIIIIHDNGTGMTLEQIKSLWDDDDNNKMKFNKIGLKNIRDRIRIIYGRDSDIIIKSKPKKGTEVALILTKKNGAYDD